LGFEKFGWVSYVSQTRVSKFVDYLQEGKLYGTRCSECGAIEFPPRAHCPRCLSDKFEWKPLSGNCSLVTYTRVDSAPAIFQDQAPYYLGLAELTEGPKIFAWVDKHVPESELTSEMKMELKIEKLQDGRILYVISKVKSS